MARCVNKQILTIQQNHQRKKTSVTHLYIFGAVCLTGIRKKTPAAIFRNIREIYLI